MIAIKGDIVTPDGIIDGFVLVNNGLIQGVVESLHQANEIYNYEGKYILPGFIDIHMHGQGNSGVFEAEDIASIAYNQPKYGTTAFLPTIASLTEKNYHQFILNVKKTQGDANNGAAKILGAHFEGPFINIQQKGGMDAKYLRMPDIKECQRYIDRSDGVIKLMTLSPELEGASAVIRLLKENDIVASLGHSRATPKQLEMAVESGLRHICHLFNAFEKRKNKDGWQWVPGLIEAIMENDVLSCELICDMKHVSPEHIKLAARKCGEDRIVAITDSMQGAGYKPGEYKMVDGREYTTRDGVGILTSDSKTIVGSILTMNRAFANLVSTCGFNVIKAAKFTSYNPAKVLGIENKLGSIEVGKAADFAILDSEYECVATFVNGKKVYGAY